MNAAHVPAYPPPNATTPIIIYLQKATSFAGLNSGLPGLIGTQGKCRLDQKPTLLSGRV